MSSSADANASPKFKNLCFKHQQSPKELKDKMRKNYKDKVKNCRQMLMDRLRGPVAEQDLCNKLTEIYKSMFNFYGENEHDEIEVLEELQNELVQEELEWWLGEYEKSQLEHFDWSTIENNDSVICPICQKSNLKLQNSKISCTNCNTMIKTDKSLHEIQASIMACVDKHTTVCAHEPQFTVISEGNESHIYLICELCLEMNMVM